MDLRGLRLRGRRGAEEKGKGRGGKGERELRKWVRGEEWRGTGRQSLDL